MSTRQQKLSKDKLGPQINEALKKGESLRVSTLRLLSHALHNEEIAKQGQLSEEDEFAILRRQIKQRKESIEAYEKAGRQELADKEKQELAILQEFLPEGLSEQELVGIVDQVISEVEAKGQGDFGKVMGAVMGEVKGKADGKVVAEIVRRYLT